MPYHQCVLTPDTAMNKHFCRPLSCESVFLLAIGAISTGTYAPRPDEGGFFLIRPNRDESARRRAFREDGKRRRSLRNKPFKASTPNSPNASGSNSGCSGRSTDTPCACG